MKCSSCPESALLEVKDVGPGALSHITSYVPEAIGNTYSREDLGRQPLFQLIQRQGIELARAEHSVNAVLGDPMVSPLLGVDIGSPLLSVNKLIFDGNERPVEYQAVLYRPDRHIYKVNLAVSAGSRLGEGAV